MAENGLNKAFWYDCLENDIIHITRLDYLMPSIALLKTTVKKNSMLIKENITLATQKFLKIAFVKTKEVSQVRIW